jgi:hypothetical protein
MKRACPFRKPRIFKPESKSASGGKKRDEMVTPPKLDIVAIEKLPRLLRGNFVIDAFEHDWRTRHLGAVVEKIEATSLHCDASCLQAGALQRLSVNRRPDGI